MASGSSRPADSGAPAPRGPGYVALARSGGLGERAARLRARLTHCDLCPRHCGADRLRGERGACGVGDRAIVASAGPHFGEERPLVGRGGSGTIFFSGCNLGCVFCQNYDISHRRRGEELDAAGLAAVMLALQRQCCENVNLVSPSHVVAQVLDALVLAAEQGLTLPLVYNTGGYDDLSTLAALDGVVDIFMPDMKYADAAVGERLSGVPDYPERNQAAVREMHRQVGALVLDDRGRARRGLLVRHLVLPDGLAGSAAIAAFLAREVSPATFVNVMAQYHPAYQAARYPPLDRRATADEVEEARRVFRAAGIGRLDEDSP